MSSPVSLHSDGLLLTDYSAQDILLQPLTALNVAFKGVGVVGGKITQVNIQVHELQQAPEPMTMALSGLGLLGLGLVRRFRS